MNSLAPALLLSMPQLLDPNFARTVVLLCKHSVKDGAFGLVLNRPLVTTGTVMVQLDPPVSTDRELDIWVGGPVEPQRSWILVGGGPEHAEVSGAAQIADGVYLSTSPNLLRRLVEPESAGQRTARRRLLRLGAGPARKRARGIVVVAERRRRRSGVSHAARPDVGTGDSPSGRGPGGADDVAGGALRGDRDQGQGQDGTRTGTRDQGSGIRDTNRDTDANRNANRGTAMGPWLCTATASRLFLMAIEPSLQSRSKSIKQAPNFVQLPLDRESLLRLHVLQPDRYLDKCPHLAQGAEGNLNVIQICSRREPRVPFRNVCWNRDACSS